MSQNGRMVLGVLLIAAGGLFFLENIGLIIISPSAWAGLFGIAGLGFIFVYLRARAHWWALIPGFLFLGIGVTIAIDRFFPEIGNLFGGAIILGGLGLSFMVLYLINQANWWAIIPGGTMLTLASITVIDELVAEVEGFETAGILFLGMGFTFGLLYFLPTPDGRMSWAIFPAGGLLLIGLLVTASAMSLFNLLWPVAIILVGLFFVLRNLTR